MGAGAERHARVDRQDDLPLNRGVGFPRGAYDQTLPDFGGKIVFFPSGRPVFLVDLCPLDRKSDPFRLEPLPHE